MSGTGVEPRTVRQLLPNLAAREKLAPSALTSTFNSPGAYAQFKLRPEKERWAYLTAEENLSSNEERNMALPTPPLLFFFAGLRVALFLCFSGP